MERLMWRYILSFLFRTIAVGLVILLPVWGGYELCRLIVPLGDVGRYADIPSILKGAVQSIPRVGNLLDSVLAVLGMNLNAAASLEFTALEEIFYVLLLAFSAPFLHRCYMLLAGLIDELFFVGKVSKSFLPVIDTLNWLSDTAFGAGAVCGGVSLAMILRDTLILLLRPLGYASGAILVATVIGLILLITIVGSVAARGNLPKRLLYGMLNLLLGILLAGFVALFANALLLIDNMAYLTGAETTASWICMFVSAAAILFVIRINYTLSKTDC